MVFGSRRCFFPIVLMLRAGPLLAQDIEWRGFLSTGLGYVNSEVPYENGLGKKPKLIDETLLGLNLSKELSPSWRMAAQLISRAAQADAALKLDWAFASYAPSDRFTLTLGRQKIPVLMHSASLDVGRTFPWVRPPEEIYSLFGLRSFTGVSLAENFPFAGSILNLKIYGGDVELEASPGAPTSLSTVEVSNMIGATAEWTFETWQMRAAYNAARWDLDQDPVFQYGERFFEFATIGIKSDAFGYRILAEFAATRDRDENKYEDKAQEFMQDAIASIQRGDGDEAQYQILQSLIYRVKSGGARAAYVSAGRPFEACFLNLTLAELKRPLLDANTLDQKSVALDLNYDIDLDSVFKLEVKKVFVPDDSRGLFKDYPKVSEALIARIGYSLIF